LGQLENVLASINDLYRTVGVNLADITSQEPSMLHRLSSLFRSLEVASKDRVALHADLSTRVGFVGREIIHFWDIFKPPLHTS